jgi:hypothetical protein
MARDHPFRTKRRVSNRFFRDPLDEKCTPVGSLKHGAVGVDHVRVRLVVRRYGVMLVCDAPVAVDLAQAHGQPK